MRAKSLVLPTAGLAAAAAVLVPHQVSAAPPLPEEGCRNIVDASDGYDDSSIGYLQVIERISQSGNGTVFEPYGQATAVTQDRGVFDAQLQLAAPSCTDVTYTFEVYAQNGDGTTGKLLETFAKKGDGVAQRVVFEDIANDHTGKCVKVRATVTDRRGGTTDTAPDTGLLGGICGPPARTSFN